MRGCVGVVAVRKLCNPTQAGRALALARFDERLVFARVAACYERVLARGGLAALVVRVVHAVAVRVRRRTPAAVRVGVLALGLVALSPSCG